MSNPVQIVKVPLAGNQPSNFSITVSATHASHDDDTPVATQLAMLRAQLSDALNEIDGLLQAKTPVTTADELETLERKIVDTTDRVAGLVIGYRIQQSVEAETLIRERRKLVRASPKKLKNQGVRDVTIQPLRGDALVIRTTYFSQKQKKGARKKPRKGAYPSLLLLGVYDRYTPGMAGDISLFATVTSSYEEARQLLKERGQAVDVKTIRAITMSFGARARAAMQAQTGSFSETVAGRGVVISTDGGRIRIRTNKKGAKTAKGRRRYRTDWREPKLLIIYCVGRAGKPDQTFTPFIDGTLNGPDAVFWLLNYYLERLHITTADRVVFVADGARWIWKRVGALMEALGLPPERYAEVVDFYHAVEHLGKIAALQRKWSRTVKKRWLTTYRRILRQGDIHRVLTEIRRLCRGSRSKKLKTERNYFVRNQHRMAYAEVRQNALPIGSGAMESAVRRVVNQKLKGSSIYWRQEHAETMLLLRAFFKAGRWTMLKQWAFSTQEGLAI